METGLDCDWLVDNLITVAISPSLAVLFSNSLKDDCKIKTILSPFTHLWNAFGEKLLRKNVDFSPRISKWTVAGGINKSDTFTTFQRCMHVFKASNTYDRVSDMHLF